MSYQIQYGQTMTKTVIAETRNNAKRSPAIKWIGFSCVLLFVVFLGSAGYLDFLIPGDKEVTTAAFESMVEDVRAGESVKDAVAAFCLEILDSAQTDD